MEERGDGRATHEKDAGATDRVLGPGVRCPYNGARFGCATPGASHVQSAGITLAHMIELRGELSVHRHRLGQSPPSHAVRYRGDPSSNVVQFRASVFGLVTSIFHRLDGREPFGTAACCLLCRGLLPRKRDLYNFDLGAY
jgi:hypothetical protein